MPSTSAVSFEVLRRVHSDDAFANLTLPKAVRVHKLEGRDAAFATELTGRVVSGIVQRDVRANERGVVVVHLVAAQLAAGWHPANPARYPAEPQPRQRAWRGCGIYHSSLQP